MTSLVDQQTTSDFHDIGHRVMAQLKTYSFFIYYEQSHISIHPNMMNLEKIAFKLKDDKNPYVQKYGDSNKNVQLNFYDLENEAQVSNSLHDLKVTVHQCKTKIVFYSSESAMLRLFIKAKLFNISIESIPLCTYTANINPDFSNFLGWGSPSINALSVLSVSQIEKDVRKWVESPTEKIDIWSVDLQVEEGGGIEKINRTSSDPSFQKVTNYRDYFVSNFSVGYHPQLLVDYEQRKSKESPFFNKLIYSLHGLKKFCCVGDSNIVTATGVVKIHFVDEKGEHEMLKEFINPEFLEEELDSKKPRNRKKILSLVLSNIDKFSGEKIAGNFGSKMNDQKLELITFQSRSESTKISSVSGKITIQFAPEHEVYLQINDSCYRLTRPVSAKIEMFGRAKILINKETLNC